MSRASILGRLARLLRSSSPVSASTAAAQVSSDAPARPEGDGSVVAQDATADASPPGTGGETIQASIETVTAWLLASQAVAAEIDASTAEQRISERAARVLASSITAPPVREVTSVQVMAMLVAAGWLALRAIDARHREAGEARPAVSPRVLETLHATRIAEDLAAAIQDRIHAIREGTRPSHWVTVWAACDTLSRYAEFAETISPEAPLRDEALLHAAADWGTR